MENKYKKRYEFEPDYVVLPGETLKEQIAFSKKSLQEIIIATGLTCSTIMNIIEGTQQITESIAVKLSVLFLTARFWMNLENNYQDGKKRLGL